MLFAFIATPRDSVFPNMCSPGLHIRQRICKRELKDTLYIIQRVHWKQHSLNMKDSISFFQCPALLCTARDRNVFVAEKNRVTERTKIFSGVNSTPDIRACEIMNRTIKMQGMPITFVRFYLGYNFLALYWLDSDERSGSALASNFRRSVWRGERKN